MKKNRLKHAGVTRQANCYYYCLTNKNDDNFLLECIRKDYYLDWRIITAVKYEDYIWWSYPNFKQREFKAYTHKLDYDRKNNGVPSNIIKIVEIVNKSTYFNKKIRLFSWVIVWQRCFIFLYYRRYYRYQANQKLFGKKNFLSVKNGPKLHFILYLRHRELTGHRLNKGHMVF